MHHLPHLVMLFGSKAGCEHVSSRAMKQAQRTLGSLVLLSRLDIAHILPFWAQLLPLRLALFPSTTRHLALSCLAPPATRRLALSRSHRRHLALSLLIAGALRCPLLPPA
eukprot:6214577-Pleurochrysis_carterae.AAC.1